MDENKHPHNKDVIHRMSRIIGHAEAVKRMLEEGKDCSDILIQIAAVKSALNGVGKLILQDHMNHCILQAFENQDQESIDKLNQAIEQLIK